MTHQATRDRSAFPIPELQQFQYQQSVSSAIALADAHAQAENLLDSCPSYLIGVNFLTKAAVSSGFPEEGNTKTLLILVLLTSSFKRDNCLSEIATPA